MLGVFAVSDFVFDIVQYESAYSYIESDIICMLCRYEFEKIFWLHLVLLFITKDNSTDETDTSANTMMLPNAFDVLLIIPEPHENPRNNKENLHFLKKLMN